MTVEEGQGSWGTITFGTPIPTGFWTWGRSAGPRPPACDMIQRVQAVAELIRQTQRAAKR